MALEETMAKVADLFHGVDIHGLRRRPRRRWIGGEGGYTAYGDVIED